MAKNPHFLAAVLGPPHYACESHIFDAEIPAYISWRNPHVFDVELTKKDSDELPKAIHRMLQRSGKPLPAHTLDTLASVVEGVADGSVGGTTFGRGGDTPIGNFGILEIGIKIWGFGAPDFQSQGGKQCNSNCRYRDFQ